MASNFQKLIEFHARFDPANEYADKHEQRRAFIAEEAREVLEALDAFTAAPSAQQRQRKAELVKELCDLLYVTYGTLHLLGVDADAAFAEVHASNMSKTPNPGFKAVKGEGYRKAEMEPFV